MIRGKIIAVICGVYTIYLQDKTRINLTPRGLFRHLKIKPIVGDEVEIENNQIVKILSRKNEMVRPLIANVDLGIIVTSLKEPDYSSFLLDKFITMLNINGIKPLIVLSKVDLQNDEIMIQKICAEYQSIGIKVIPYSSVNSQGIDDIKAAIKGKTIVFTGQTGVGKSSLINMIDLNFSREIGEFSLALKRGKHKTKEVVILPYEDGYIADTPGFSSLELDCYKEDLKKYFPFFMNIEEKCFFNDCNHINEPKCAIIDYVKLNKIPQVHYDNYKDIFEKLIFRKDRFK